MTSLQEELIKALLANEKDRVPEIIDEISASYATLYILYIIKYTKWNVDELINVLEKDLNNTDSVKEFCKTLQLMAFI